MRRCVVQRLKIFGLFYLKIKGNCTIYLDKRGPRKIVALKELGCAFCDYQNIYVANLSIYQQI